VCGLSTSRCKSKRTSKFAQEPELFKTKEGWQHCNPAAVRGLSSLDFARSCIVNEFTLTRQKTIYYYSAGQQNNYAAWYRVIIVTQLRIYQTIYQIRKRFNNINRFIVNKEHGPVRLVYGVASSQTLKLICSGADDHLFNKVSRKSRHLLHVLLPSTRDNHNELRVRRHNFTLPSRSSTLTDCNFINRMLYEDLN
jgi:hypothetical protein